MNVFKYLLILLVLPSLNVFSTNTIVEGEIKWHENYSSRIDEFLTKKYIHFNNVKYDESKGNLGIFSKQINLKNEEVTSISILNIEYEDINTELVEGVTGIEYIKGDIDLKYSNAINKKQNFGIVSFTPIIYDSQTGTYKRVTSYKFSVVSNKKIITATNQKVFTSASVLQTGEWFKVGVLKEGVFKLSYSFLRDLGMDIDNINPTNIKIYGNGGKMLPEKNSDFRYDDLQQNAIHIEGETDGVFDVNDFVLFYGQEADSWEYSSGRFKHLRHRYSDTTYYFITASNTGQPSKRIVTQSSSLLPNTLVSSFDDYAYYEKDLVNLIRSGNMWLGEVFDIQTNYNFVFNFPNIVMSSPAFVNVSVAGRSSVSNNFTVNTGSGILNLPVSSININSFYARFANLTSSSMTFNPSGDVVNLNISYNKPNSLSIGWLDEIELNVRRNLIMSGNQLFYRDVNSVGVGNISEFTITNASEIKKVWNISDPLNIKEQSFSLSNGTLKYVIPTDILNSFIALTDNYETQVIALGGVSNQNLHSIAQSDMVIVSHPKFLTQAAQLSDFHVEEGLSVSVVTPQQIYNEYSSGSQDIVAIRDFLRMLYERAPTTNDLPKYLLLFGDGSYDNKNRLVGNTNFIPSYQTPNSIDVIGSLVSDDYYGLLDTNEGSWATTAELVDIGIGRLPVKNQEEANNVVNKILNYNTSQSMNDWRNRVSFVGDDEDFNTHMTQADALAALLETNYQSYNVDKVYMDAFKQESTPGGARYPDVNDKIDKIVNDGSLIVNYTGHGGEVGWAHERILTVPMINAWENKTDYPLVLTATCEFSRWDDPARTSAGELVLLNSGGGIGLFTTVRLVFSSPNFQLNKSFYNTVFTQVNGEDPTMGEVFRIVKNLNASQVNNRNFTLLGDPALKLAYPKHDVATTKLNGVNISAVADTIKALSKVTITGVVQDQSGVKLTNFNGVISPIVFDKPKQVTTLQNDGGIAFNFDIQTSKLFKGKVSVQNGDFSFSFYVPKDISFNYGKGKLSYYAENQVEDAHGNFTDFYIGGTADSVDVDTKGPELSLFMNDDNFVFGGITDENPILLAKVSDLHGINMVGNGIGHDIVAVLDDKTEDSFILNDFYEADLNSYEKGTIRFPFKDLEEGRHKLTLTVWDVYNNSTRATIEFVVVKSTDLTLERVYNYPNPFTTYTEFWFEHNQPGKQMHAQVQIFTVSGKLVKTLEQDVLNEGFRSTSITWNGLDQYGDRIGRGVYVYKLKVRTENFSVAEKYEKLVILR
jgi:Peptidase family C25